MANHTFPHPAVADIVSTAQMSLRQRSALAAFIAADSDVFRATGIQDAVSVHDSSTFYLFDSLADIRFFYLHPRRVTTLHRYDKLVLDVSRAGAYKLLLLGQLEAEDREEFQSEFSQLLDLSISKDDRVFWSLLNAWCGELLELGLTRRGTQIQYIHDVCEPHRISFPDAGVLSAPAKEFLKFVTRAHGDVALAMLNIEGKVGRLREGPLSGTVDYLTSQARSRFRLKGGGVWGTECLGCGLELSSRNAARFNLRAMRKHIHECEKWNELDARASRLLATTASGLNVIIDQALGEGTIPGLEELVSKISED